MPQPRWAPREGRACCTRNVRTWLNAFRIVTVSVPDGDDQLHVAFATPPNFVGFATPPNFVGVALGVGSRLPAYLTAGGRLMSAHKSERELDAYLARIAPIARTKRTITDKKQLKRAIGKPPKRAIAGGSQYSMEFKAVA